MTKFFFKFKKLIFGPFPKFLGQKRFLKKRNKKKKAVMHNFIMVTSTLATPTGI